MSFWVLCCGAVTNQGQYTFPDADLYALRSILLGPMMVAQHRALCWLTTYPCLLHLFPRRRTKTQRRLYRYGDGSQVHFYSGGWPVAHKHRQKQPPAPTSAFTALTASASFPSYRLYRGERNQAARTCRLISRFTASHRSGLLYAEYSPEMNVPMTRCW